jgi:hypothetical protein
MKPNPLTLSGGQAKKQRHQVAITGLLLSVVSLFVLPLLGIAVRALILTNHTENKKDKVNGKFRVIAIMGIALGAVAISYQFLV